MGAPPDYTELPTSPKWRRIKDEQPPIDVGVLVSDGTDVTAARWITEAIVTSHGTWGGDGCELDFDPKWWMPLPAPPRKDT